MRVGLNYQLGEAAAKAGNGGIAPLEGDNWAVHGQTTFVSQYAPSFRAPYHGQNSLDSNAGRQTWDATLYVGRVACGRARKSGSTRRSTRASD